MPSAAPFRRLRDGDAVAVVAPASRPQWERVERGIDVLRWWGFEPTVLPSVTATHSTLPHLAGDDDVRAEDLIAAWRDCDIAAIWCARGGYGIQRILDLLPTGLFGQGDPKPIIGFSDITPLLHRALLESGTQMVHGPVVVSLGESGGPMLEQVHDLLTRRDDPRTLLTHLTPWLDGGGGQIIEGTLLGGNVALLANSIGTGDLPSAEGAVVLLEDTGQPAWVLDRNLTQLIRAGWLAGAAGVLLGDFTMDDSDGHVQAVLRDRLGSLGVPVWTGARIGHGPVNQALPIGAHVRIDSSYLRLA